MKKIILILLIVLELLLIKIPPYVELNDLAIIENITVTYQNNQYTLTLKEIIPIKADQQINYKYKIYKASAKTIKKAYKKIKTTTKKKLYLTKVKSLTTNLLSSDEILIELNISPKTIIHT